MNDVNSEVNQVKSAKVELSFKYKQSTQQLKVGVIKAFHLGLSGVDGKVFARINLLSEGDKFKFRTKSRSINDPVLWNEQIAEYKLPQDLLIGQQMQLQIVKGHEKRVLFEAFVLLGALEGLESGLVTKAFPLRQPQRACRRFTNVLRKKSQDHAEFCAFLDAQNRLMELEMSLPDRRVIERLQTYQDPMFLLDAAYNGKHECIWKLFNSELDTFSHLFLMASVFKGLLCRLKRTTRSPRRNFDITPLKDLSTDIIFGNIEKMKLTSLDCLLLLEPFLVKDGKPHNGSTKPTDLNPLVEFLENVYLPQHLQYQLGAKRAHEYVEEMSNEPIVAVFLLWCEEDDRAGGLSFADLLNKPLGRAKMYPEMLLQIFRQSRPTEDRHTLLMAISSLDQNIQCHSEIVGDFVSNKATDLDEHLIWNSPSESSPESYVPAEFREQLKSRPNISVLADACHVSDELYPSRQHKFDSELHLITSAGKEGQSLTGHLVGDLVLLCKPLDKSKRRSEEDIGATEIFFRPMHISELEVILFPANDRFAETSFLLVVRGILGQVDKYFALKCPDSKTRKAWVRHLRHTALKLKSRVKPLLAPERQADTTILHRPSAVDVPHDGTDKMHLVHRGFNIIMKTLERRDRSVSDPVEVVAPAWATPQDVHDVQLSPSSPRRRRRSVSTPPAFASMGLGPSPLSRRRNKSQKKSFPRMNTGIELPRMFKEEDDCADWTVENEPEVLFDPRLSVAEAEDDRIGDIENALTTVVDALVSKQTMT